jgi:ATP-dependent exoDNAse (exonuclease V), alpha subunit - helicase superfamily I member
MYANVAGIDNINATIQDAFNPYDGKSPQVHINHQVFRVHDRVLQLKNQPEDDIYNGDIGEIIYISSDLEEMIVRFDVGEIEYSKVYFQNLTLAYAISIHKSQGSEFNHVIMGIFKEYGNMLNKQLLYTGITRAKQTLTILGDYKTFLMKSMEENKKIRKTTLVKRIKQFL